MSRARDLADGTFSGAFSADSPTLVVDDTNNRVGVGIASPATTLEISNATSNAAKLRVARSTTQTNYLELGTSGGSSTFTAQGIAGIHGDFAFFTKPSDSAATERLRILPSGGITFNGDTAAANALDDYEEGSWTPGIAGTTSGVKTMGSNNLGRYTKIGQKVTVTGTVEVSGTETISGLVMITGLPFVSRNVSQLRHAASMGAQILCNLGGASKRLVATLDHNQSSVWLMEQDDDAASYSHTPPIGNSGAIYGFTLTYITDA